MPEGASPDGRAAAWLDRIRIAPDGLQAADLARRAVASPHVDAPAFLQALKDASKAALTVEPSRAVVLAEALQAGADAADLPWFQALSRMARGDAYGAQGGRVADAVAELDAAAAAFQMLGDKVAWARTRIGWIYLRGLSGLTTAADLRSAERARQTLAQADQAALVFAMDRNLIACHWHHGRLDQAEACFVRALAAVDRHLDGPGELEEAGLRANRGLMLTSQGRLTEALQEQRRARDLYAGLGQHDSLRRQEHNLGHLHLTMGDPGQALTHFYRSLGMIDGPEFSLPRGLVLANIARCHLALGSLREGVAEAREALEILGRQGADAEALRCSLTLAQGLVAIGDHLSSQEAERILEACLADPRLVGLRAQDGMVRLDLAELALRRGDAATAARWSSHAQSRFRDGGLILLDRMAALVAAEAALIGGRSVEAGAAAEELRLHLRSEGLGALLPRAWHLSARVAESMSRDDEARAAYREAVDALDEQVERLPLLLRTHVLDQRQGLLADGLACYRRSTDVDDLWWMLERTKAQSQIRRMVNDPAPMSWGAGHAAAAAQTADGHDLATRLRAAERAQAALFALRHAPDWLPGLPDRRQSVAALADLDRRLADTEASVTWLREQLALTGWDSAIGAATPRRRSDWLPPCPPESTVLAAFGLSATEPFVLLARGNRRAVVSLASDGPTLAALALRWQEAIADAGVEAAAGLPAAALTAPLCDVLGQLFQALVAPWQDWLDGAGQLVVVPHGALHGLPFGAFHDGRSYLVERLVTGHAPSTAWWDACRHRAPARPRAVVAAYSHGAALPGAAEEGRRVAGMLGLRPLLEAEATREAVLSRADGAGLLHLAAHAAARQDRPSFAHLWLAGEDLLSSHDLANLDLRGALVTLSGCETSSGLLTGADEVLSLSRACLHAGAATVLGTLWPLRDAAALPLMTGFYDGLLRGQSVGDALRRSQLAAMSGNWPSPLDWAAFQCLGSCDTMLPDALIQEVHP